MKSLKITSLLFSIFLCFSSCDLFGPKACDDISKADLIVDEIATELLNVDTTGPVYQIINLSKNIIYKIACPEKGCEGARKAGEHAFRQNMYYSASNDGNWGNPIEQIDFQNSELPPCRNVKDISTIRFLQDGFYLIEGIIDILNEVDERDESNNNLGANFAGGRNGRSGVILHITGTSNNARKGKLIEVISAEVVYE